MESKKINQLATELSPALDDLTIIGDPTTGISRKITLSQMASLFTGTVEEYASLAAFPLVGTADTIYIALDTNILYRWSGSAYVELSPNIVSSLVFDDANGFDGTITLVGSVATLSITTALTLGSLPFIGASGALTQDNSNLFYDDTNNRLGIGTNAPTTPLDVFGSGIISRINGTSTNNGFLGFASAGTNKWSVGNVQSDHRFRIFSEANSAELVSLLQTGEFGIGIANPLTKLHIDGGATALIANLDANVSVAKSLSFRSDNSNRINLEVSGTESGSNAGANFFIRRYSDAGALIDTPFTITRSTGLITLATALAGLSASFSSTATASAFIPSGASVPTNGMYLSAANTLDFATNSTNRLSISSAGAATFSGVTRIGSGGTALGKFSVNDGTNINLSIKVGQTDATAVMLNAYNDDASANIPLEFRATKYAFTVGAATFSSGIGIGGATATTGGIQFPATAVDIASANNLDDYEEGTWTPGITFGSLSAGLTYSLQSGFYTKIGRQVTLTGIVNLSNKGSSVGSVNITGLPFTVGNANGYYSTSFMRVNNITFTGTMSGLALINFTLIGLEVINAGTLTDISNTNFANNSSIILSLTYFV